MRVKLTVNLTHAPWSLQTANPASTSRRRVERMKNKQKNLIVRNFDKDRVIRIKLVTGLSLKDSANLRSTVSGRRMLDIFQVFRYRISFRSQNHFHDHS